MRMKGANENVLRCVTPESSRGREHSKTLSRIGELLGVREFCWLWADYAAFAQRLPCARWRFGVRRSSLNFTQKYRAW